MCEYQLSAVSMPSFFHVVVVVVVIIIIIIIITTTTTTTIISIIIIYIIFLYSGPPGWGLSVGLTTLPSKKRKLLRSFQKIQPDFEEEAKA
jgi:hypothetical protein